MRNTARTLTIGALTVGALTVAPSAFADDTVTQEVLGGTLTASVANLALNDVTSMHDDQFRTGQMTLAVDDATGTGAGWSVTETVSDFEYSGAYGGTAIPAANFVITSVEAATSSNGQAIDITGTDLAPTGPQSGNITTGVAGSLDVARTVLRAGATYGQGIYGQVINVSLTTPAESRAGVYTGTLTTTVTAAP